MIGKNDIEENFKFLDIDMKKRSQFGSSFLTLYTDVQTEFENLEQFPSSTFRLDLIRPDSRGDAKCKVFKGRSSAKYYTGFVPVLKDYNGGNGLLRRMTVYQCDPASSDIAKEFTAKTQDCNDGNYPPHTVCKSVLFIWTPGSGGEMLQQGAGLEALLDEKRKHYFLLENIYNAGTGFLSDNSGVELFYSRQALQPAGKMIIGHRHSNKLVVMPEVEDWRTTGLCSSLCLRMSTVNMINISSVSLHAGDQVDKVRLVVMQEGRSETVVSGYRSDYQPVRQLYTPYGVDTRQGDMVVECTYSNKNSFMLTGGVGRGGREECFAVVTYTPKIEMVECVSEPDKTSMEDSYNIEYEEYSTGVQQMMKMWTNLTEVEKKEVNIKSYNNSLAIFCTNHDLTKTKKAGVKAPTVEEESNTQECPREPSLESKEIKSPRNGRVLDWDADIRQFETGTKNTGSAVIKNLTSVTIFMIILLFIL